MDKLCSTIARRKGTQNYLWAFYILGFNMVIGRSTFDNELTELGRINLSESIRQTAVNGSVSSSTILGIGAAIGSSSAEISVSEEQIISHHIQNLAKGEINAEIQEAVRNTLVTSQEKNSTFFDPLEIAKLVLREPMRNVVRVSSATYYFGNYLLDAFELVTVFVSVVSQNFLSQFLDVTISNSTLINPID